ncbi:MAG: hypothetical protein OES47_13580 [Acidobacteriota bacterium]|nr:hypothetical protein [Acidobacteriota bacterium]
MTEASVSDALVEKILAGGNRQLQVLAAQGLVPLARGELIPLQVSLAASVDSEVAQLASKALAATDPQVVARLIAGAEPGVIHYFARNLRDTAVLQAVLSRRSVSHDLLIELAPDLDPDLQEILLLRQDAIVEEPGILEALEANKRLSSFSQRRIQEYRDHLLPKKRAPAKSREEIEREADELTESEVEQALDEARQIEPGEEKGEIDELTGLNETQIRSLQVPVRLKLSRGGSPTIRSILIRDPNPMVATSVLRNNPMTDSEIERVASNRAVVGEVLEAISRNRQWTRKYAVVAALARNPRTPVGVALRFLPRLAVRDIQKFSRDRNLANAVRTAAKRLYKIKRP